MKASRVRRARPERERGGGGEVERAEVSLERLVASREGWDGICKLTSELINDEIQIEGVFIVHVHDLVGGVDS